MLNILVVGDLILDEYLFCDCLRISPEAPVPVINPKYNKLSLGGCANVALNIKKLGANVDVLSVLGNDECANFIKKMLKENEINYEIISDKNKKSSKKTRIFGQNQQIVRIDVESCEVISDDMADCLFKNIEDKNYDAIVFSDYDKGVLSPYLVKKIISFAKNKNILTLADPKKDFLKFKDIDILTPNYKEATEFLGLFDDEDDDSLSKKLILMKEKLNIKYPLITLGKNGIALYNNNTLTRHLALAKEVFDVTGAGDSVISSLAYFLSRKKDINEAIKLANKAAAIVVSKIGSYAVSIDEINEFSEDDIYKKQVKNISEFVQKNKNKKIVFTNGCFDLLHLGHLSYLRKAKQLGDLLVIGLNSDESIKRLKGLARPINDINTRLAMLCALEFIDAVIVFSDDTPLEIIKELKPDILVKGADYKDKEIVGSNFAKQTCLIDFVDGYSSTNIINKIKETQC